MTRTAQCWLLVGIGVALGILAVWQPLWIAAGSLVGAMSITQGILGCLLLSLVTPLISGRWQPLLAPGTRLGLSGVPLLIPLWLPMLLAVGLLYPWVGQVPAGFRGVWLSPVFFLARTLAYGLIAWWLTRWALQGTSVRHALGVIVHVLVFSLAGIDWFMSLQADFASSLFGLLLIARQLLAGLAFAVLYLLCSTDGALPVHQRALLRGLLVAALSLWLYLHAMQYLIIWSVDLQEETAWYRARAQGYWGALTWLLLVGQALCLLGLASPWGDARRVLLGGCIAIVLLGCVESMWMALPALFAPTDTGAVMSALACQLFYAAALTLAWRWRGRRRRHDG